MKPSVLIIDDEDKLRNLLKRIIALEGYEVYDTGTINAGRQLLEKRNIDIILCDVKLPDGNGVEFAKSIKEKYPDKEIILLTAYGNIPDGIQAMKNGAFDYIVKGNDNERIIPLLTRAYEKVQLQHKVQHLEERLKTRYGFDTVIGESIALHNTIALAKKVAPTQTTVLMTGETGTGKEVFAQAIHYSSTRRDKPFVALNCSALSKDIIESELFGHKAGAFTSAAKDKKGLIEEANGGTLFLDEIGEMPLDMQPKLLRFLENGAYYCVGDTIQRKADVRLVAATNRNLQLEVEAGRFRSDLYYRIAVFLITIPALRERKEDIEKLAEHYMQISARDINKKFTGIAAPALAALRQHTWPGNVRELKNVIERAAILEDSTMITTECLPYDIQNAGNSAPNNAISATLARIEQQHIVNILKSTGGNKTEAARILDIGIATLYRKIDEYGLK